LEGKKNIKEQHRDILEKYKKMDKLGLIKYKSEHFILVNSIVPKFEEKKWTWENTPKKRLLKEFSDLTKSGNLYEGIQIYGLRDNIYIGVIEGPPETPYEKWFFLFEILLTNEYPFGISKLYFKTKIFHPNIGEEGLLSIHIYFDTISGLHNPATTLIKFVLSVQSLLDDPNPYNFLNEKAAKLYK